MYINHTNALQTTEGEVIFSLILLLYRIGINIIDLFYPYDPRTAVFYVI